jgi:hypothetical protein
MAGQAYAQPSDASERATARVLFSQANQAAESGDWNEAAQLFGRAYSLVPDRGILFNLATAQEQAGLLVESSESYRSFVLNGEDEGGDELMAQARASLARVLPRLAHLQLDVTDFSSGDELMLDGAELPPEMIGVAIPVNPGLREVEVICGGQTACGRGERSFAEGERASITVALARPATVAVAQAPAGAQAEWTEPPPRQRVSPWVWGGVTAAVLAAAGATTLLLVTRDPDVRPGSFEDAWRVD